MPVPSKAVSKRRGAPKKHARATSAGAGGAGAVDAGGDAHELSKAKAAAEKAWQKIEEDHSKPPARARSNQVAVPKQVGAKEAESLLRERLAAEKAHGTHYKPETYMAVTRWTAQTRVKYGPNPKTRGSKSYDRYDTYAKATTAGEALALGAYPPDLLWDLERGFYKAVGGPMREQPLDLKKAEKEGVELTAFDRTIGRWVLRELAKELGMDRAQLMASALWAESTINHALRLLADREARATMARADVERRPISDDDVLRTMRKWTFARNPWRANVMPEGVSWVYSDTLGINCGRDGSVHATTSTPLYPNVSRILCRYIRQRMPQELGRTVFHFTSINLNYGYGAVLHRDSNNLGNSMITAFGTFQGGELIYWPEDDHSCKLQELPRDAGHNLDLRDKVVVFDGTRAHEVAPFTGERYSIVWFTCSRYARAGKKTLDRVTSLGYEVPTRAAVKKSTELLHPPRGYGAKRRDKTTGKGVVGVLASPSVATTPLAKRDHSRAAGAPAAKRSRRCA